VRSDGARRGNDESKEWIALTLQESLYPQI
jgi:hypothetical protein